MLVPGLSLLGLLATGFDVGSKSPAQMPPLSQHFRSRPDLKPPVVHVRTHAPGTTPGFVFIAPKLRVAQAGPLILDDDGQVVWFKPLDTRGVTDFRVQRYRFETVIPLQSKGAFVAVRALARGGQVLGSSTALKR